MNNIAKTIREHGKIPILISIVISISFYFLYLRKQEETEELDKWNLLKAAILLAFIASIGIYYNCKKNPNCELLKNYHKSSPTEISIDT